MVVEGNVKGLKKGVLYLQSIADSTLFNLDSVEIRGDGNFHLKTDVLQPDIFYLYLENDDNNTLDDRIVFFGEPGNVNITTQWDGFEAEAEIRGGKSHKKFEEFRNNMSRFNLRRLELAREIDALEIPGDSAIIDSLQSVFDRSLRRSYLYAINFALNNKDSYLSPYIAWAEVGDANPKLLDSVYRSLPPHIADSKYGKKLKELLGEAP